MKRKTKSFLVAAGVIGFEGWRSMAFAGELAKPAPIEAVTPEKREKSVYDQLWALPTLYKNEDSAFLNELRITGRFHLDEYNIDSNRGHDQDWMIRRFRLGSRAEFFERRLTLKVEMDLDAQDPRPLYDRLTDAYLSWKFSDSLRLTVGKQAVRFTLEGSTSSNELLTIDRSDLANNLWFTNVFFSGASLSGKAGNWYYTAGVFSGGSNTREFGNFDAGYFGLASVGYDFADRLRVKKAFLRADYVYNQRDPESDTRPFESVGSLIFVYDDTRWGFSTDLSAGTGYAGQGDLFGFVVIPWYNITNKLQAVARYTCLKGDKAVSVRLPRYENLLVHNRGDDFNELYAGLNYYLYGHKLKLQTGVSWEALDHLNGTGNRYTGWTWTTGLRVAW